MSREPTIEEIEYYDGDITAELVARIQEEANKHLGDLSNWTVIDDWSWHL